MADRCNTIRLYSFQTDVVYQVLKRDGVCYSEEATFSEELKNMGMNEFQIMTSNFYPEQKARIQESWKRLFGHQQAIEAGDNSGVHSVQAGLWCIKDEWIVKE